MSTSERVTSETCPQCGRYAAVGWLDETPVEVDCASGCPLTGDEFARRGRQASASPPPARWTTAAGPWR
jgi:hypothetical protein